MIDKLDGFGGNILLRLTAGNSVLDLDCDMTLTRTWFFVSAIGSRFRALLTSSLFQSLSRYSGTVYASLSLFLYTPILSLTCRYFGAVPVFSMKYSHVPHASLDWARDKVFLQFRPFLAYSGNKDWRRKRQGRWEFSEEQKLWNWYRTHPHQDRAIC